MSDGSRVDEIVGRWREARDRGEQVDAETLIAQHPGDTPRQAQFVGSAATVWRRLGVERRGGRSGPVMACPSARSCAASHADVGVHFGRRRDEAHSLRYMFISV